MFESDADRLAMLQAAGEQFDTGKPMKIWLIFDREFLEQTFGEIPVEDYGPRGVGRSSDVAAHELVKKSVLTRDADGKQYTVKRLEDDGMGMTLVVFSE